jgi:diadenosine tetraphosphatase ApaH/serine/threonine PP2A family protein phosphatase
MRFSQPIRRELPGRGKEAKIRQWLRTIGLRAASPVHLCEAGGQSPNWTRRRSSGPIDARVRTRKEYPTHAGSGIDGNPRTAP